MATRKKKPASAHTPEARKPGTSRKESIQELMGQLNTADRRVIAFACDVPNTYELRRPSGLMQLDIDTGGGLPAGGLCCLTGPEGSGKTELMLNYMAMHQKLYGENACIAIAPVEGQFDFKRARQVGMSIRVPKRMVEQWRAERAERGAPDFTKEERGAFNSQVGEVAIIGGLTGEDVLEAILECHKKNIFGLIGLDSINGLQPAADAQKDLEENDKRAARATLLTRFFARYIPSTSSMNGINETTIIMIQQVRANPDKATAPSWMQGSIKDWALTGAWATRHFKLVDVTVWDGQKIKKTIRGEKVIIGKEIKWKLEKGKAGCHDNVFGSSGFYYDGGISPLSTIITTGIRLGVLREGDPDSLLGAQDFPTLELMLRADPEVEMALRRRILAAAGVECLYR